VDVGGIDREPTILDEVRKLDRTLRNRDHGHARSPTDPHLDVQAQFIRTQLRKTIGRLAEQVIDLKPRHRRPDLSRLFDEITSRRLHRPFNEEGHRNPGRAGKHPAS